MQSTQYSTDTVFEPSCIIFILFSFRVYKCILYTRSRHDRLDWHHVTDTLVKASKKKDGSDN